MGLELKIRRPQFRFQGNAVTLLLTLALIVLLVRFSSAPPDLDVLRRYAERMLTIYDAAPSAPPWQRDLLGEAVRIDLQRDVLLAYRNADLDDTSRFQLALIEWRFGMFEDAMETLGSVESEAYRPLIDLVWSKLDHMPPMDPETLESATFALLNSDSWWSYHLRKEFPELGLQNAGESMRREEVLWRRMVWVQGIDWGILLLPALCWLWLRRSGIAVEEDKYFLCLGGPEGLPFFWAFLRAILLFLLLGMAFYSLLEFFPTPHHAPATVVIETLYRILPALMLAWWFFPSWRLFHRALGLDLRQKKWPPVLAWTSAGLVLGSLLEILVYHIGIRLGNTGIADALDPELLHAGWAGFATQIWVAGIVAPIGEEIIFRGMLYPVLRRRLGVWPALLLHSSVFAVIHLYTWLGAFSVFLSGILFGWLFEKSKSLWPPILVHAIGNILATVFVWMLFGKAL